MPYICLVLKYLELRTVFFPASIRSHRHHITSETSKKTHPREEYGCEQDRSPRGSIGPEIDIENRSPRGSLARANIEDCDRKSPRGSLTLTFQEPLTVERRASTDNAGELKY